jgi:hypothetical protein
MQTMEETLSRCFNTLQQYRCLQRYESSNPTIAKRRCGLSTSSARECTGSSEVFVRVCVPARIFCALIGAGDYRVRECPCFLLLDLNDLRKASGIRLHAFMENSRCGILASASISLHTTLSLTVLSPYFSLTFA